jgi:RNA-binding protein
LLRGMGFGGPETCRSTGPVVGEGGAHDTLSARSTSPIPMPTSLTAAQKRYLRSLGHHLKPVILVGTKGITPALLAELEIAMEHHELVKVKVAAGDRDERDAWIGELVKATGAALAQRVGNIATLYRPRRKDPGIVLPR